MRKVLAKADVPHVVKAILHAPMALNPGCESVRWRDLTAGGGDDVDNLHAFLLALEGDGAAQLGDLGGTGKVDSIGHLRNLDCAGHAVPATGGDLLVGDHVLPGRREPVATR